MRQHLMLSSAVVAMSLWAGISVQPAAAADMPTKAPAAPTADPTWTGCYVGGNVGATWGSGDFTTTLLPGSHLGTGLDTVNSTISPGFAHDTALIGGGQLGCNWQTGALVVGPEGDFSFSSLKPSQTNTGAAPGFTFANTNSLKMDWLATVRPRVGVTFDRTLLYVTGGLAVAQLNYTQTYSDTLPDTTGGSSASATRTGWTIGGGWNTPG
jgi:outer membrane immunogenic protein